MSIIDQVRELIDSQIEAAKEDSHRVHEIAMSMLHHKLAEAGIELAEATEDFLALGPHSNEHDTDVISVCQRYIRSSIRLLRLRASIRKLEAGT